MKDAIIKEIRKDDSKVAKSAPKENADANGKKKRIRINKEKVDVNNVASNFTHPTPLSIFSSDGSTGSKQPSQSGRLH